VGDNACGVFQADLSLKPGESKELLVLMGIGQAEVEGRAAVDAFSDLSKAGQELDGVKSYWHSRLSP